MSRILYTGGMRSGKSLKAELHALQHSGPRLYIATAEASDEETKKRIERHKKRRGKDFITIEEPLFPEKKFSDKYPVIMLDCLTHWYNNIFFHIQGLKNRQKRVEEFIRVISKTKNTIILVTNEVGWGIIPENKLAREYLDFAGEANQMIQKQCHEMYVVIAGVQWRIK